MFEYLSQNHLGKSRTKVSYGALRIKKRTVYIVSAGLNGSYSEVMPVITWNSVLLGTDSYQRQSVHMLSKHQQQVWQSSLKTISLFLLTVLVPSTHFIQSFYSGLLSYPDV